MPPKKFRRADPLWIAEVNRRFEFGRQRGLSHVRAVMSEVRTDYAGLNREQFMETLGYSDSQWDNWFNSNGTTPRNGPPFAVVQGIIYAFNVPPEVFDVDFVGEPD